MDAAAAVFPQAGGGYNELWQSFVPQKCLAAHRTDPGAYVVGVDLEREGCVPCHYLLSTVGR